MSAAENVSEALTLLMHYCRIVNESVRLKLAQQPDGMLVDASFSGIARHRIRQNAEFQLAVVVHAIREITGLNVCPTRVARAHGRTTDVKEFERFFGCPVENAASCDRIEFSNETLALPLITAYALNKRKSRTPRRLYEQREKMMGELTSAYQKVRKKRLARGEA